MEVFFKNIFNPKPNEVIDDSKSALEARALSDAIEEIRTLILGSYSEDALKDACNNCLMTWGDKAKFRLADLALELNQNSYPMLADHVWDALDKHFSEMDYSCKQYYSTLQGLKELADHPDCGLAAYIYGIKLYLGDDIPKDKQQAYIYLKKSTECGSQLAFQFFQSKQFASSTPSAINSPLNPKYKSMVEAGTYTKNAQRYFSIGQFIEAERELERAASLKGMSIIVMGDRYKLSRDYKTALLCYEIAARSGDEEAKFKSMKIKADQGNADQQYQLAIAYFRGGEGNQHPAKDLQAGSLYVMKAVDQNHVDATFMVAELHLNWYFYQRDGGPNNEKTSIAPPSCFAKSSDPGANAFKHLSDAAKAGHERAKQIMQMLSDIGGDRRKICTVFAAECGDRTAQFEIQKIKADKGHVEAMAAVGVFYRDGGPNGKNPEKNVPLAIKYFKQAINKGNPEAQLALSTLEQQLAAQESGTEETTASSADQKIDQQEMAQKIEQENSSKSSPTFTDLAQQANEPESTSVESQKDTEANHLKQADEKIMTRADEEISTPSVVQKIDPPVIEQENSSELAATLAYFIQQATDAESTQIITEDETEANFLKQNNEKVNAEADEEITPSSEALKIDRPEVVQEIELDTSSELLPTTSSSSQPLIITTNYVDAELAEQKNNDLTSAPKLDNLFLENIVPIVQAEVKPVAQLKDNTELPLALSTSSQQITIGKEEAAGKVSEESSNTSGSSTTFIFICLLFAVPFTAVVAHQYYKKRSG